MIIEEKYIDPYVNPIVIYVLLWFKTQSRRPAFLSFFVNYTTQKPRIVVLNVNGVQHNITVDPDTDLLTVLRDWIGLTGSKYGCGEGACGACTVLINGNPSPSCITPVHSVAEKEAEVWRKIIDVHSKAQIIFNISKTI